MYIPFYTHPSFSEEERRNLRNRWNDPQTGEETASLRLVKQLIAAGAKEEFLNEPYYSGRLPVIEYDGDLRGLHFWELEQDFGGDYAGANFKGIDLSHSEFYHCHIRNAVFYSSSLRFAQFVNCIFEQCTFAFTAFLGSTIRNSVFTGCEFQEACCFENVKIVNSQFNKCFLGETTPFNDCWFDSLTGITELQLRSSRCRNAKADKAALAGYYSSFQNAYEASGSYDVAHDQLWKGRQAFTRYNLNGRDRIIGLLNEALTGYGMRPLRPLIAMAAVYAVAAGVSTLWMPLIESMTFVAGAMFTSGTGSEHLKEFGFVGRLFYASLSFLGVGLMAAHVTVLANVWFHKKVPNVQRS